MSEHTHTLENGAAKRLERSRSDRMVAGVCGGLARYFDIHPAFYRVGFVVLTLLGGAGVLIYAAAALVMPDEGKEDSVATAGLRWRRRTRSGCVAWSKASRSRRRRSSRWCSWLRRSSRRCSTCISAAGS